LEINAPLFDRFRRNGMMSINVRHVTGPHPGKIRRGGFRGGGDGMTAAFRSARTDRCGPDALRRCDVAAGANGWSACGTTSGAMADA